MVYAVVDYVNESIPPASSEALLGAAQLAGITGAGLGAVVVSSGLAPDAEAPSGLRGKLARHGVKAAILITAEGYRPLVVGPLVDRLFPLLSATPALAWVVPGTVDWRTAAARLAARQDLPLAGEVVEFVPVGEVTGDLGPGVGVVRPVYGGNLMSREWVASPCVISVRAKAFAGEPDSATAVDPGSVTMEVRGAAAGDGEASTPATPAGRVVELEDDRRDSPPLEDAAVIVSGGRGLGGPAGLEVLRRLARALGGAVGASRAAVDAGWIPYECQVGQSGRSVGPRVYLALGISGAAQHLAGMRGAKAVVVVNRNPEAPFFSRCTYGVVADWREFAEALLAELTAGQPAG